MKIEHGKYKKDKRQALSWGRKSDLVYPSGKKVNNILHYIMCVKDTWEVYTVEKCCYNK